MRVFMRIFSWTRDYVRSLNELIRLFLFLSRFQRWNSWINNNKCNWKELIFIFIYHKSLTSVSTVLPDDDGWNDISFSMLNLSRSRELYHNHQTPIRHTAKKKSEYKKWKRKMCNITQWLIHWDMCCNKRISFYF